MFCTCVPSKATKMSFARLVRGVRAVCEVSFYDDGNVCSQEVPMSVLFAYSSSSTMQLELKVILAIV